MQVGLGRNAMAIYQELVDRFGTLQQREALLSGLRSREPEQLTAWSSFPECQVGYGEGAPTRHPTSGRYRRPRLFVMTLRLRRSYRHMVWKSKIEVLALSLRIVLRQTGWPPALFFASIS